MKQLRISPDLVLPLDTVTSTLIAYGGKGMGKTNLGSVLVEELTRCGLRWAWLDPLGVSWGLRHSADGRGPGVECLILGGLHGDVPILPAGGAAVADVVVDESTNVLVDFSRKPSGEMWTIGEKISFVTAYTLRLFQRQGEIIDGRRRAPLFQVLDEAARYIPQSIPHGEAELAKCVGAWNQLVEEGRNVGVGVGLLTQRSARMNKSVSELADAMFAFRTVGPNSLEAVLDWLGEHVEKKHVQELAVTVRSLERGRALVVSPGWLKFEGVVKVRMRETFDSSATVKHGERARTARGEGAKPNLARIRERMAEAIERVKADDPRELKKAVAELRAQVAKLEKAKAAPATTKEDPAARRQDAARIRALTSALGAAMKFVIEISAEGFLKAAGDKVDPAEIQKALDVALQNITKTIERKLDARNHEVLRLRLEGQRVLRALKAAVGDDVAVAVNVKHNEPFTVSPPPPRPPTATKRTPAGDGAIGSGERTVLTAVAQHQAGVTREQLTVLTGYKRSSRDTYLQRLRSGGLVDQQGDTILATDAGLAALGADFEPLPTGSALREYWRGRLPGGELRLYEVLIDAYPKAVDRDALSEATDYKRSSRDTYLQRLNARQLIELVGRGAVRASSQLFEEA